MPLSRSAFSREEGGMNARSPLTPSAAGFRCTVGAASDNVGATSDTAGAASETEGAASETEGAASDPSDERGALSSELVRAFQPLLLAGERGLGCSTAGCGDSLLAAPR